MQPIGYYVHHQGKGHLARAMAIAEHQPERFVLLGTGLAGNTANIPFLELGSDLPDDSTEFDAYTTQQTSLHYAPLNNAGIRERTAALASWIAQSKPALIVCDVSVEIAMLARLTSTPSVYIRLSGNRIDPAHYEAFRSATALLCPFHPALDNPETPEWIRKKTGYFPGITATRPNPGKAKNTVLVINGAGGDPLDGEAIAVAAIATPRFQWRSIGAASTPLRSPPNLNMLGWIPDPATEIANAAIIIGAAGDGLVSEIIAAGKKYICIPQPRPFNEQAVKAIRLQALGAAITLEAWPAAMEWPGLLDLTMTLQPAILSALHDPKGARKAFEFLTSDFSCLI